MTDVTTPEVPSTYGDPELLSNFPMVEQGIINAALQLLDGPATKNQKETMLALSGYYQMALRTIGAAHIEASLGSHGDENTAKMDLISHVEASAERIVSSAQYAYYKDSFIERARYFMAQTKLRRTAGSLAIGAAVGGITTAAEKGIQHTPGLEKIYALSLGAGAVGLAFNAIKPRKLINSVVSLPGNRLKRQANRGIQQYDTATLKQIREQVRQLQDSEMAKKVSYELITKESIIHLLHASLCTEMIGDQVKTPEHRQALAVKACEVTVDWLLAFYGVAAKNDKESEKDDPTVPAPASA